MPLLPWGAWKPDTADYEGTEAHNILNVVPRGDGYGPFASLSPYTAALPGPCRGAFYALKFDGTVVTFAATATNLYQLNNTNFTWTNVSLSGGPYSSVSASAQWQFAQTGNFVFATQANVVLQVFDLSSATAFAVALGSPPQAAYISVVGRFLVLSGLLSQAYRIQWSGLNSFNASTSWQSGTNSSDFQDFPDGGLVRGVAGGDQSGVVFQDQAIRRMAYVPGSPIIFQIDRLSQDKGLFAPYSIIRAGENLFFYAGQGFHKIPPGGFPVPIGRERVDRTFLTDLDIGNLQLFMGTADPRSTRIYWAYKSAAGVAGAFDKLLGYDFLLDKFFPIASVGEYLLGMSQTGLTLESLDAIAPTPLVVTGAAAAPGTGAIRLTLVATSNANFNIAGQNTIEVYGINPSYMNGSWATANVTGTTVDLVGSTFGAAWVSGGAIGGSLDAMTLSLDAYATAVQPELSTFSSSHALGFFRGTPLEATMQSAEQGTDGARLTVKGFRPITDASVVMGSLSYRDTQAKSPTVGAEVGLSRTGRCDMMRDARYVRFQTRIPAGTPWTFSAGVEPDTTTNGSI